VAEGAAKSDSEKLGELYEDWYGSERDKHLAFRDRFRNVERWVLDQQEAAKLKAAEEKGKRFLFSQVAKLLQFVGFSGLLLIIGFAIRFINSWRGGVP
jgi:hypothetical protein